MNCPPCAPPARATSAAARRALALVLALLLSPAAASHLAAQSATATLRGVVSEVDGGPVANATLVARNTDSGFVTTVDTDAQGFYNLAVAPGPYRIEVLAPAHETLVHEVRAQIGQVLRFDFELPPTGTLVEEVTVTATGPAIEMRGSEVATNVTSEQIEHLPQSTRNFLSFATLAPGVRLNDDEFRREISSGALSANHTNVFIDGASFKNDVLQGGVVGQDSSRGNPFPQNAVQEYRVINQNYRAEYEKAAGVIITAVTKSGTNELRGDLFGYYQDKDLVAQNDFAAERGEDKPTYERFQVGVSVGGPIVRDRAHFFGAYEGNYQDRAARVFLQGNPTPEERARFGDVEGFYGSPFDESLYFGKLSYAVAAQNATWDLRADFRDESDERLFDGTSAPSVADSITNRVANVALRNVRIGNRFLNEAQIYWQNYNWQSEPLVGDVGQLYFDPNFVTIVRIGGRDSAQDFEQERLALQESLSWTADWRGSHAFKGGFGITQAEYQVAKRFNANPLFKYKRDLSLDIPFEADYGSGDPNLDADNTQYGIFLQDEWAVTPRLSLSLGLRWDYESDMLNNDYVTPPEVRAALQGVVPDSYFTDGDDRDPYYEMFQPRLGLSWDVRGTGTTVAYAAVGRFYDRVLYNETLDERFRLQWATRRFRFSPTGAGDTIAWDPRYFSAAGLDELIASGQAPLPEAFLIDSNQEPPVSDQYTLGVRQSFGRWVADLSYVAVDSDNIFTWRWGNRRPDGSCCASIQGYSNVLLSDNKQARFDGVYFKLDRPFARTPGSSDSWLGGWGFNLAYTYGEGEQTGGDLFSLDFPFPEQYGYYPTSNDERHRLVMSGIVQLPWDLLASGLITLGSGTPYTIFDSTGPEFRIRRNEGRPEKYDFIIPDAWAYRSVDLRLEKSFRIAASSLAVIAEAINVFDFENYGGFDGTLSPTNANFGEPSTLVEPGRRYQVGLRLSI
jgi:outer membrane receptor protein involved in Fe transport